MILGVLDIGYVARPAMRALLEAGVDVDALDEQCASFVLVRDLLEADIYDVLLLDLPP